MATDPERLEAFLRDANVPDEAKRQAVAAFKAEQGGAPLEELPPGSPGADAGLGEIEGGSGDAGFGPTALRLGGAIVGSIAGSRFGPMGSRAGAVLLGTGADYLAQQQEIAAGEREEYNPARTVSEGVMNLIAPGMSTSVSKAALKGGAFGALAPVITDLVEGKPLPSLGELAMGTAFGATLSGATTEVVKRFTSDAAKIVTGSDEIAKAAAERAEELPQWIKRARVKGKFVKPDEVIDMIIPRKGINLHLPEATGEVGNRTLAMQKLVPTRTTMDRMQRETGLPIYADYYAISDLSNKWTKGMAQGARELKRIFKGTDQATRIQYSSWLMSPEDARAPLEEGLSKVQVKHLHELDDFYTRAFSVLGTTREEFFGQLVPQAMKKGAKKPEGVADAVWELAEGLTGDSLATASKLLRESTFNQFLRPRWAEAVAKYDSSSVPPAVRKTMMNFLNGVKGMTGNQKSMTLDTLAKVYMFMDPNISLKEARAAANEMIGTAVTANSGGLLGYRPGPIIRNSFQGIQTGAALTGGKWYVRGVAQAATEKGRALAREAGVEGAMDEMAELQNEALVGWRKGLKEATRFGLKPFSKVEDLTRASIFLGTRAKFIDAFKKSGGDVAKFAERAELGTFRQAESEILRSLFTSGARGEDIAAEAGKMMVNNTQWMYGAAERAPALSTPGGRLFGGFGTWPASYADYLREFVIPGMSGRENKDAGKILARSILYNGAVVGALGTVGTMFGDKDAYQDQMGWIGLGPLAYSGGPMLELAIHGVNAAGEVMSGRTGRAASEFVTGLKGLSPVGAPSLGFGGPVGAAGDIEKAINEPNLKEAAGRYLGFKRGKN